MHHTRPHSLITPESLNNQSLICKGVIGYSSYFSFVGSLVTSPIADWFLSYSTKWKMLNQRTALFGTHHQRDFCPCSPRPPLKKRITHWRPDGGQWLVIEEPYDFWPKELKLVDFPSIWTWYFYFVSWLFDWICKVLIFIFRYLWLMLELDTI